MSQAEQYRYAIDPEGHATANKILHLVGTNRRVLELGTAVGSMTQAFQEQGCRVTGIEYDPELAKEARPYCERMVVGDLETLDIAQTFGEQRFDAVVAADVLEHLRDPWAVLRRIRGLIDAQGSLVISVPNIAHGSVIASLLGGRFPYQEKGLLDRTHLRFFTREDLEAMLLSCGYVPLRWETHRVPAVEGELGAAWLHLPEAVRNSLGEIPWGDVYQFIVEAAPAGDATWQRRSRQEITELTRRAEADEQRVAQLEEELGRAGDELGEYSTAFAEARTLLQEREESLHQCQAEIQQQQGQLQTLTEQLATRDVELEVRQGRIEALEKACIEVARPLQGEIQQLRDQAARACAEATRLQQQLGFWEQPLQSSTLGGSLRRALARAWHWRPDRS